METANIKKILKVVCTICMVIYAIFVVVGILMATNVIPPEAYMEALDLTELFQGPDAALYTVISGVVIAIAYGIRFLFTLPIVRNIQRPSKLKLGLVLYAILIVFTLANLVMTLTKGGNLGTAYTQLICDIFIFGTAFQIYRSEK